MATQKVVVGGASVTGPQWKELVRQVVDGELKAYQVQAIIEHRNPWDFTKVQLDWRVVYEKLGLLVQLEEFVVSSPLPAVEGQWVAPVVKGVTPNQVVKVLRELGVQCDLYREDLDGDVKSNDRDPETGSYLVSFQATVEADPELANQSAKMLAESGVKGITLLERLLLELAYFLATAEHLDVENWTLCSGSRDSGGSVPSVDWHSDGRQLAVHWRNPGSQDGSLRARAAVS